MVKFILRNGYKSKNDTMVFLIANDEVLTFQELLFILKHYFKSEHEYYPIDQGYLGKAMLLSAVCCVACGVPFEVICKRFNLPFKILTVVDHRTKQIRKPNKATSMNSELAELM